MTISTASVAQNRAFRSVTRAAPFALAFLMLVFAGAVESSYVAFLDSGIQQADVLA